MVLLNKLNPGLTWRSTKRLTESLSQTINNSDIREEFSDDLDRYIRNAAEEIASLYYSEASSDIPDNFSKEIIEILIENIYIPVVMGEDGYKGK